MTATTRPGVALLAAAVLAWSGCDSADPLGVQGTPLRLELDGLAAIDPDRTGVYEAWVVDRSGGAHSAGRFSGADAVVQLTTPISSGVRFMVTLEPPGDADDAPSPHVLLHGDLSRGGASLGIEGAVTAANLTLRESPGQWTVFTPSDNFEYGYPSNEHAGVWLFNSAPRETEQGDFYVRLSPLRDGWMYEGWIVRDFGTPGEVWLSYGKFRPSPDGTVDQRDHTGWGPFSGVDDYRTAGAENYPGDDWVSNPFGYDIPGGLELPLDLREQDSSGQFRWTHVITVEPAWELDEPLTSERPFVIRPYVDRFTDTGIGRPRPVTLRPERVPHGRVTSG